jgi:hypothetical protein
MTNVQNSMETTLVERGNRYGKFKGHADVTQELKSVMRGHCASQTQWTKLTPSQCEALEMIVHKIGRILNVGGDPNYDDTWVDIAGYAQLVVNELRGKSM